MGLGGKVYRVAPWPVEPWLPGPTDPALPGPVEPLLPGPITLGLPEPIVPVGAEAAGGADPRVPVGSVLHDRSFIDWPQRWFGGATVPDCTGAAPRL